MLEIKNLVDLKKFLTMTKQEAIQELKDLLDYWRNIKFYANYREQEAVEYAINYMEDEDFF